MTNGNLCTLRGSHIVRLKSKTFDYDKNIIVPNKMINWDSACSMPKVFLKATLDLADKNLRDA